MFTSKQQLVKKSGRKGVDRFEFLQQLVAEFHATASLDSKEQTLANLANFSYDPLNYTYLRELRVVELFLDHVNDRNVYVAEFALKGICNLTNDPLNREIIFREGGVDKIKRCLVSDREETLQSVLTALFYLITPFSEADILTPAFAGQLLHLVNHSNVRVKNLVEILLLRYSQRT